MTQISAKVVADSKNEFGNRITTMVITFPRFILAELNTHRMMSRNSASSRAIPFEKMLESVEKNPFIPIAWQKDHKGMQGTEYLDVMHSGICKSDWLIARDNAVKQAVELSTTGCTKQLCNRLLEPFMWHTVIITATEWENFFALRCPRYEYQEEVFRSKKDTCKITGIKVEDYNWFLLNKGQAEIHMMALAEAMWDAYNESIPQLLEAGEWHIPFGDFINLENYLKDNNLHSFEENGVETREKLKVKIATAHCARISYTIVGEEGKPINYNNDIKLHDNLAESGHWSPFEHCAKVMTDNERWYWIKQSGKGIEGIKDDLTHENEAWSGNFRGFIQYRKTFQNENITKD